MEVKEQIELHKCFSIEFIIKAMSTSVINLRQEADWEFHHRVTVTLTLGSFPQGQPARERLDTGLPGSKPVFFPLSLILWIVHMQGEESSGNL